MIISLAEHATIIRHLAQRGRWQTQSHGTRVEIWEWTGLLSYAVWINSEPVRYHRGSRNVIEAVAEINAILLRHLPAQRRRRQKAAAHATA